MARIYIVEPGPTGGPGAMGAAILSASLVAAGHECLVVRLSAAGSSQPSMFSRRCHVRDASMLPRPDAWFVSCVYVRQWLALRDTLERCGVAPLTADRLPGDPVVAFGGQVMISPAPISDFADLVALGDGEATGVEIAGLLDEGLGRLEIMGALSGRRGFWAPSLEPRGRLARAEIGAYTVRDVRPGTHGSPTVEVARGCRSRCAFCPIGWAGGAYREADRGQVAAFLARHRGAKINAFAPDYSSVSWSLDLTRQITSAGCKQSGKDARLDAALRDLKAGAAPRSFSFGVEGLSERLRAAIGKPLEIGRVVDTMAKLDGVRVVKWYLIFGLPGETPADRDEFYGMFEAARRVYSGRLELTLTHFQSVPHTPLQWAANHFDAEGYQWVMDLRSSLAASDTGPKGRTMCNRPKGRSLHTHDAWLQRSGREVSRYLMGDGGRVTTATIRRDNWGKKAAKSGVPGPAEVLGAIRPGAWTPWDMVDSGSDRDRCLRMWDRYQRMIPEAVPCGLEGIEVPCTRGG
jgi:hypothetical protein